jgi:uncharacterized protein YxjI
VLLRGSIHLQEDNYILEDDIIYINWKFFHDHVFIVIVGTRKQFCRRDTYEGGISDGIRVKVCIPLITPLRILVTQGSCNIRLTVR